MSKTQILYPSNNDGGINDYFINESIAMNNNGFMVGSHIHKEVSLVLYRGFTIQSQNRYPCDNRLLQHWDANKKTLFMSEFYPIIEDLSIPTFFVKSLDEAEIIPKLKELKWDKAFIKSDSKSLFCISDYASVWPYTDIHVMEREYIKRHYNGPFAIRKFIENPQIFYEEKRYWVLNGITYHPSGVIPNFVQDAANRLYKFSKSHYFTIDVAGDYIVEVNPGESSDRGGDTPLDFFCRIFAENFLQ